MRAKALSTTKIPADEFLVDRSRLIDFQECPRQGYYRYGYSNRGIVPSGASLYLVRGHAIHAGVALLFGGMKPAEAIGKALKEFEAEARKGLEIEKGEDTPPSIAEESRLIEGALWAFCLTLLPRLVAKYKILAVENEESVPLGPGVTMLARADALLEDKVDKSLEIFSLKTSSSYDSRKEASGQTDIQGLSEALAVEHRLGREISRIQMCYLILGRRKTIETDIGKETITQSPFAWGYRRIGAGIGQPDEYAASLYFKCDAPHLTTHTKKPSQCSGGKTHKLGDDFEMFPTDEYPTGIEGWIRDILNGEVQPRAELIEGNGGDDRGLAFLPRPYFRQRRDIESFKRQAFYQAKEIKFGLSEVSREGKHPARHDEELMLDIFFRQHKHRCHYPGECDFLKLCFPPPEQRNEILENPLKHGYQWRKPNHPAEEQVLPTNEKKKGK